MSIIEANGIQIAYDIQGPPQGETILLIAGLGLQLISWPDEFCAGLVAQGFRVIRFDNRDSGLSTKMDQYGKPNMPLAFFKSLFHMPLYPDYTVADMATDAIGLLDALGVKKAHMVGASMGGIIAQIIAARYPERTRTLTSIMSTSGRHGLPGPTFSAQHALFSRPRDTRDVNCVIDHYVNSFKVLGSPRYPTPDAILRKRVEQSVLRNVCVRCTARQVLAVAASGDRSAELRAIKVPALVIHGTDDPLVPIACGRDTAHWIPGAVLREIEGMGHDLPPALDEMLSDMIAGHCKSERKSKTRSA